MLIIQIITCAICEICRLYKPQIMLFMELLSCHVCIHGTGIIFTAGKNKLPGIFHFLICANFPRSLAYPASSLLNQ